MTGLAAVSLGRVRALLVLLGAIGAMLLAADAAAADEGGIEDSAPLLGATSVSPGNLSYEGGNVQYSAEVTDDFGLSMVYATIYLPGGGTEAVQLFEGGEHVYYGTLEVPPNYSESSVEYGIEIQAWDTNGAYIASLIGGVQEEGAPQFDEAPYITLTELFPQVLPAEGGPVTFRAIAGDNRSLSAVFGMISLPGGGSTEVGMYPIDANLFEGTFTAPPNAGPLAAEYQVEVVAQDDIGQEARMSLGTVTVEAPPVLPGPGELETWSLSRSFGTHRIGTTTQRVVGIRNVKRKKSGPIEVTARLAGPSDFSLPDAPGGSVHFWLNPGESQLIPVDFSPTAKGSQAATLEIIRADGGQPGFAVNLTGTGVKGLTP